MNSNQPNEIITDAKLDVLAGRFNQFRALLPLELTFGQYVKSHTRYDVIINHMMSGGGCRVEGGCMVPNREVAA